MNKIKRIEVYYHKKHVGSLVEAKAKMIAFQYSKDWLKNGFSISPISLPLNDTVFIPKNHNFNGLFGVFADSLPDSWGRLLLNRMLKKEGVEEYNELLLLALVAKNGMGALEYLPVIEFANSNDEELDYDKLSLDASEILKDKNNLRVDSLYHLGGSSGGARPKAHVEIDGEKWIVKFNTHLDNKDSGKWEYLYSLCAKKCGIEMMDTRLISSKLCDGFFATKRFDFVGDEKIHIVSVASLLEVDFRAPVLDYRELFKLTKILTKNNENELLQLFKRMCFNVFAHNQDDHVKNFSFMWHKETWKLSPAFDLTYSSTYFGEHTTSVNGKGKGITSDDLLIIGKEAGLNEKVLKQEIDNIYRIVSNDLYAILK